MPQRWWPVVVNEFLEVPGYLGVWSLGDCAAIPDKKTGRLYPPTAQHALRQGKVLGGNIAAAIQGRTKKPFVFKSLGQLAAIGRRSGVAKILGIKFSGFIAWWLWRTIYLSKLPRLEKKLRVTLDWTLDVGFLKGPCPIPAFTLRAKHAERCHRMVPQNANRERASERSTALRTRRDRSIVFDRRCI